MAPPPSPALSSEVGASDGSDKSDKSDDLHKAPAHQHPLGRAASPLYFAKGDPTEDPDRGVFFIDRVLRHEVPKIARDAILDRKRQEETGKDSVR